MNARTAPEDNSNASSTPRFDAKFIEEHQLVERYLENKLPAKGARDLENWCRAHPDYLAKLKLSDRTHASLKLLEQSGQPQDLREPGAPWWKSPYLSIAFGVVAILCLGAFLTATGKNHLLRTELEETRRQAVQGTLVQPATQIVQRLTPDHAPNIDQASVVVNSTAPQLIDLHLDMAYTQKLNQFRVFVDKKDQGRALVLDNVLKDSNNELRITFNTTGLSVGTYTVRIEALPLRGDPIPDGWFSLVVK